MQAVYFTPHALDIGAGERGCFTCRFFQGEFIGGHVVCRQMPKPRVVGTVTLGCAYWEREPGSDDE